MPPDGKPFWEGSPELTQRVANELEARENAAPAGYSDDALALRFTAKHGAHLRYVAAWGKWLQFDGRRWQFDNTLAVFDLARALCRDEATGIDPEEGEKIKSARTVAAVERLAKSDRSHAATVDQFDTDPWLLNTPDSTVDLRTGTPRSHTASDHLTRITAVSPGGDCPTWMAFLDRVTAGDADLQAFLQRIMGYALTGSTRDHALFFAHGSGGNGKGVFLNTMTRVLGDYAAVASMETFIATQTDRHPTDLAALRGARLVTAQETEEGRRWAEAKIKALTGGDPITARFMRKDFFTFQPQFKLMIAGNHKPSLHAVDEAIRRRFHLLPFTVSIPAAERDSELPEKLRAEWGGILAWAVQGCLEWQRIGLQPPAVVREATEKYLSEEDTFATWIEECCEMEPGSRETSADLFQSWSAWAERNGEKPWTKKRFSQAMEQRGFEAYRTKDARGHTGLRLIRPDYSDDPRYR